MFFSTISIHVNLFAQRYISADVILCFLRLRHDDQAAPSDFWVFENEVPDAQKCLQNEKPFQIILWSSYASSCSSNFSPLQFLDRTESWSFNQLWSFFSLRERRCVWMYFHALSDMENMCQLSNHFFLILCSLVSWESQAWKPLYTIWLGFELWLWHPTF